MRYLFLPIIFVSVLSAVAQSKKFGWSNELCEFEGTYNAKNFSATQLKNTLRILSPFDLRLTSISATVWKYEDIQTLNVQKLDADFDMLVQELTSLDFVKTAYTLKIRAQKLKEARQLYELMRITMRAYNTPSVIRDYSGASECKRIYGEPIIAGGDDLLAVWKKVNEDTRKRNADPDRIRRIFEVQLKSPDKLKYALVETMAFGWWNCANDSIPYLNAEDEIKAEKEFKKLFISVRNIRCDEP